MSSAPTLSIKRPLPPDAANATKEKRIRKAPDASWDLYRLWPRSRTAEEVAEADAFKKECERAGREYWRPAEVVKGAFILIAYSAF
jgi:hypothetical protein